jgi:hypothetical protein
MKTDNADTLNHNGSYVSWGEIASEVRKLNQRIDEMLAASKAERQKSAELRDERGPRDIIMAALEERGEGGKMRGHMTFAELRALLKCGNSSVIHHTRRLVKEGKAVVITLPGDHGKPRQELFHADAVAL